jgi:Ca2+-binding RTX toxin-like protein
VNIANAIDNVENFTFTGTGNWSAKGNALDNVFTGGAGNDTIDGGAGNDTVVFTGKSSDYQIVYSEGQAFVVDLNAADGNDGVDGLRNVEHAQFSDITVDLGHEVTINGATAGDQAGRSVSTAGDVNGDGFADFIIGASGAKGGAGSAYVVFGGNSGFPSSLELSSLNGSDGFKITGVAAKDAAGFSVSGAGDINKDGFDDFIVGSLSGDGSVKDSGAAYVVFGHSGAFDTNIDLSKLNGSDGFKLSGGGLNDFAGSTVHSAGDLNGDGYDDLVVGADASDRNGQNSGTAYVVFGHGGNFTPNVALDALNGANGFAIAGWQSFDHNGWSVSSAGDVNGDGVDDLLVGAVAAGTNSVYTGEAYVLFGHSGSFISTIGVHELNGTNGFVIKGEANDDAAGFSVSSAGDINGDGFADFIVGAPYGDAAGSNSGTAYVVFGHGGSFPSTLSLSSLNGSNGFRIDGLQSPDYAGFSVSSAGDLNGDGLGDLIIGAPNAGSKYEGAAYVLYGRSTGFGAAVDVSKLGVQEGFWIFGDNPSDAAGISVSSAGDVDGDGRDDLLVGAAFADPHGKSSGAVELILSGGDSGKGIKVGGLGVDNISGTDGDDVIHGLLGNDVLNGLGGDDFLDGGAGSDTLSGGTGNDVYILDNPDDKVIEAPSSGIDTIEVIGFDVDLTAGVFLGQEIENVTLLGGRDTGAIGNALNNVIIGNGTDNRLSGGLGDDTLIGGDGNDTYVVDSAGDAIVEKAGGGIDTVETSVDYALGDYVENLVLKGELGTENLSGVGSAQDNTLTGNAGDNHLDGGNGNDILVGGKGGDVLTGGSGNDLFVFAPGDTGVGTSSRDVVTDFVSGQDRIDLSQFDANSVSPGDDLFHFIGISAFEQAGDLRLNYDSAHDVTILEGDLDGDHTADFQIEFTGMVGLTGKDFTAGTVSQPQVGPSSIIIVNDDDRSLSYSGIRPTVSEAGDLNNDGYADVVIGLEASGNAHGKSTGNAYVIYGSQAGIPATISLAHLDGSNGVKVMGAVAGESLGYGADTAGDFNGDGVSDLVISAPWYSSNQAGSGNNQTEAYLLFGNPAGIGSPLDLANLNASQGVKFLGQTNFNGGLGSVASLGDINADGLDDIAIGAPDEGYMGNAYVVFGSRGAVPTDLTKLDGKAGFIVAGEIGFGGLGQTVASAGDLNGDGIKDLLVSESASAVFGSITAHVIFGHAGTFSPTITVDDLDGITGFSVINSKTNQGYYFNQSMSSAGDFNGDGYDDLIIGGNGSPSYIVFGHGGTFSADLDVSTLDGSNGFAMTGPFGLYLGRSVSGIGDFNGDGYDDVLIGAPNEYNSVAPDDTGHAFVLYGSATGFAASVDLTKLTAAQGFEINGQRLNEQLGWSVSGAGDIDGDGLSDLILASPQGASGYGSFEVIYGKSSGSAIQGLSVSDLLTGSSSGNIILGGQGNDLIAGKGGADSIKGGSGNDDIHVADNQFFRIDGGSGTDTLHLDYAGAIDFGNIDGNSATSDRGKIAGIEIIDTSNGQANALTLHKADLLDLDVQNTNVGGVSTLDNVLKIDGDKQDTLHLFKSDGWSLTADTSTLPGYAIYTVNLVRVAVDTDIAVSLT